jgi:3-mercaptopyruvate sulfurtransferase SseA
MSRTRSTTGGRLLVSVSWLSEHINDPDLVVIDVRPPYAYHSGHIRNAVNLDLYSFKSRSSEPEDVGAFNSEMERQFRQIGVNNDSQVVFYEDTSGPTAARGVWLMDYYGHERAAMLDGGLRAWQEAGHGVSHETPSVTQGTITVNPQPESLASADYILDHLHNPDVVIWDTRHITEHAGTNVLARRGGTIPGAVNLEWVETLEPDGTLKDREMLRRGLEERGITPDKEVVSFCQSGFRSSHAYLVARLLGYPRVRNYITSWSEWGNRPYLPIEQAGER